MMSTHYDQVLDAKSVKQAARNQWKFILESIGIDSKFLVNRLGKCPGCKGTDRFRFDDKGGDGTWFCNQSSPKQAGDGFSLLRHVYGWGFIQTLKAVSDVLGGNHSSTSKNVVHRLIQKPTVEPDWELYSEVLETWSLGTHVVDDDPSSLYVRKFRGIPLKAFPPTLRSLSANWRNNKICTLVTTKKKQDIMLAAITNARNEIVNVEQFFLTPDGQKAYPLTYDPKRSKSYLKSWLPGVMNGCAIKLFEPADALAIAEGLETALAWYCQNNIPVWAATSAGLMESVIVPDTVQKIIILADNDANGRGEQAAHVLAERMLAAGKKVQIRKPSHVNDYADLYASQVVS